MSEHGARALHVSLEKLCGCNQAGLLCWRQARCLGFGTQSGTVPDTRQVLQS